MSAERLFEHFSNIPKMYFPKAMFYVSHKPLQLLNSINHAEFIWEANLRDYHILLKFAVLMFSFGNNLIHK